MIHKKSGKIYLLVHAGLLVLILLFPLYRLIASWMPASLTGCLIHDRFFLYCPLCGGTRAVSAILRLDFAAAFANNAFVVLLFFFALALDVWALIRLLRGHTNLLPLPSWVWIVLVVVMLSYAVLRNYLMISHGIDPVGDLGPIWKALRQHRTNP